MKRIGIAVSTLIVLSPLFATAATIGWNMDNVTTAATSVPPSSGTPVANLAVSDLTRANGGAGALVSTTSSSSGYTGASGTNDVTGTAPTGALSVASSMDFSFTLTPSGGNIVNVTGLSFGSRSTTTGPTSLAIYSSADNFTTALGTSTSPNDSTWNLYNPSLTPVASAADTALTFRIYGGGGAGTAGAGNWRVDDITLTYSLLAVPEPATLAMLLLGGGLLASIQRVRSKRS